MTKQKIIKSEWAQIGELCKEFDIDLLDMAEVITEHKIKSRGRAYDEINQKDQPDVKLREIPQDIWEDGLIETDPICFLYVYRPFAFQNQNRDIQVGYIDIEINKQDFQKTVISNKAAPKKRMHEKTIVFREIYDECKKGKDWVGADAVLQHILDNYDDSIAVSHDEDSFPRFALSGYEEDNENKRKSVLIYSIDGNTSKTMTLGRFCNIISHFNKQDREKQ